MEVFKSILIGGDDSPHKSNLYTLDIGRLTALVTLSQPVKAPKKSKGIKNRNRKTYYKRDAVKVDDNSEKEIQLLEDTATTTFNIEEEFDELA
jgi:hypothetical protein